MPDKDLKMRLVEDIDRPQKLSKREQEKQRCDMCEAYWGYIENMNLEYCPNLECERNKV